MKKDTQNKLDYPTWWLFNKKNTVADDWATPKEILKKNKTIIEWNNQQVERNQWPDFSYCYLDFFQNPTHKFK